MQSSIAAHSLGPGEHIARTMHRSSRVFSGLGKT